MVSNSSVSVVMATYNGSKYIREQIISILPQLEINDELLISDDGSSDDTIEIINEVVTYTKPKCEIRIVNGPKNGVIKNFERLIELASKQIVVFSDQDDIWDENKIMLIKNAFQKNSKLKVLVHDFETIDSESNIIVNSSIPRFRVGRVKNFFKNTFIGANMAARTDFLKYKALPFPENIPMHDSWIGILAKNNETEFITEKLTRYRRHELNLTGSRRSLKSKMLDRLIILKEVAKKSWR